MISVDEDLLPINKRFANEYNLSKVLKKYNNPEKNIKTINIVGTNGKGSTSSFLSNALKTKEKKVGLFISPAFLYQNERIQINNEYISDQKIFEYLKQIEEDIKKYNLTFFEIWTLIAILYFNDEKVDIAVFESGIGGLKDPTNLLTNQVMTLLTSVSYDHTEILGNTIEEIIYQKVMIAKENTILIIAKSNEKYLQTIKEYLKDKNVKIIVAEDFDDKTYQKDNKGLATKALELLDVSTIIKDEWKPIGRMTVIKENPFLIIDGAHNVDGIKNLVEGVKSITTNKETIVLFAASKEKDYKNMVSILEENFKERVFFAAFDHFKAWDLQNIKEIEEDKKIFGWEKWIIENQKNNILVCGSLYFVPLVYSNFKK